MMQYCKVFLLIIFLLLSGCQNTSDTKEKGAETGLNDSVIYKKSAISSNGILSVYGELEIKGPQVAVQTAKGVQYSDDIDNKFSSIDGIKQTQQMGAEEFVQKIEIGVPFEQGLILDNQGKIIEKNVTGDLIVNSKYPNIVFDKNLLHWIVSDTKNINMPILSEIDVEIKSTDVLNYSVYSLKDIISEEKLTLKTGSSFKNALVAQGKIILSDALIEGRVYAGDTIFVANNLTLAGTLEAMGDITVQGSMSVEYLDNVYKTAKRTAYQHLDVPHLVHSKLFKDLDGQNSVAIFTYVNSSLMDEKMLEEIVKNGTEDNYEFLTVFASASSKKHSIISVVEGLTPYHKESIENMKVLESKGYSDIEVSGALSITDNELFFFYTSHGVDIGTYKVLGTVFGTLEENNLVKLTASERELLYEKYQAYTKSQEDVYMQTLAEIKKYSTKTQLADFLKKYSQEVYSNTISSNNVKNEFTVGEKGIYQKYNLFLDWNNIASSGDLVERINLTKNGNSSNSSKKTAGVLQGAGSYMYFTSQSGNVLYKYYFLSDWNQFYSNYAIKDNLDIYNSGTQYTLDQSSFVTTAMILKYLGAKYGLNKFQYSNNKTYLNDPYVAKETLRSRLDATLHSMLTGILASFKQVGITDYGFYDIINAKSLYKGINDYLADNNIFVGSSGSKHFQSFTTNFASTYFPDGAVYRFNSFKNNIVNNKLPSIASFNFQRLKPNNDNNNPHYYNVPIVGVVSGEIVNSTPHLFFVYTYIPYYNQMAYATIYENNFAGEVWAHTYIEWWQ